MAFAEVLDKLFGKWKAMLKEKEIVLCMGNEACDIDSFLSSIAIAAHEDAIFVVNMPRKVFEAKGDLMYLVGLYKINLENVIFLERPKGAFSLEARKLGTTLHVDGAEYPIAEKEISIILVDHHKPVPELADRPILLLIDHHALSDHYLGAKKIYVDTDVASCATLVAKFIGHSLFYAKHGKNSLFASATFCKGIAGMLMVAVSVDSKNLHGPASHFDHGEFRKLKKISKISGKEMNKIRKEIKKMRLNDDGLESSIIMQKDYKGFTHRGISFGISTVKYGFKKWVDREAGKNSKGASDKRGRYLEFEIHDFMRENGLNFFALNRKNKKKRFFAIFNCFFEKQLASENNFEPKEYRGFHYYEIPVDFSRKASVPAIKKLIDHYIPSKKANLV